MELNAQGWAHIGCDKENRLKAESSWPVPVLRSGWPCLAKPIGISIGWEVIVSVRTLFLTIATMTACEDGTPMNVLGEVWHGCHLM